MSLRDYLFHEEPGITLYCGDCREVLPHIITSDVNLVVTDPPYGLDINVDNGRFSGGTYNMAARTSVGERIKVAGDDQPFDPAPLLRFKRLVLFGAQNYAASLPPSNGWLVWDKRVGLETMRDGWPFGEGELAWTNVTGAVRFFRNRWMGLVRDCERGEHYHPTQKPLSLMRWVIESWATDDFILDPYAGSGTTLVAAKEVARRAIGIEINPKYSEIAVKRLRQEVLSFP